MAARGRWFATHKAEGAARSAPGEVAKNEGRLAAGRAEYPGMNGASEGQVICSKCYNAFVPVQSGERRWGIAAVALIR